MKRLPFVLLSLCAGPPMLARRNPAETHQPQR